MQNAFTAQGQKQCLGVNMVIYNVHIRHISTSLHGVFKCVNKINIKTDMEGNLTYLLFITSKYFKRLLSETATLTEITF